MMHKMSNIQPTNRHVMSITLISFGLLVMNLCIIILVFIFMPQPYVAIVVRSIFALLLSLYAISLARNLSTANSKNARKYFQRICMYVLAISAIFLVVIRDIPLWLYGVQIITVLCYSTVLVLLTRNSMEVHAEGNDSAAH